MNFTSTLTTYYFSRCLLANSCHQKNQLTVKSKCESAKTSCVIFALLLVLAALSDAAKAAEMSTSHPGHYIRPGQRMESLFSQPSVRTKHPAKGSNVILHRPVQLREEWSVNATLSSACRRGTFRQRREHQLVAILAGKTYGAAVGGHHSLIDTQSMGENRIVYIFKAQGTSSCRVYHRSQ